MMRLRGTGTEIAAELVRTWACPQAVEAAERARLAVAPHTPQLLPWQAVALYVLAAPYNRLGAHLLEIGTAAGYSAAVLAQACRNASLVSLNPAAHELTVAAEHLTPYANVALIQALSWDFLPLWRAPLLDLVWVDGDHRRLEADLPWFDRLRPHGLLLLHDYSPVACPAVCEAVARLSERLGREPDVEMIDDQGIGMAGFYRGPREVWEG